VSTICTLLAAVGALAAADAAGAQPPLVAELERGTEGRRELQAALDERTPTSLVDRRLKDSREARALLDAITGKS